MEKVEIFLEWAKKNNRKIEKYQEEISDNLPKHIIQRYPRLPDDFLLFLGMTKVCVTPDEKSWFLCYDEYKGNTETAFAWDEIEKICLVGDKEEDEEIIEFWDTHLPIALSVRNCYAYFALDVGGDFGAVVYGFEPYFEEPEKVASSFCEFLGMIMAGDIEF